MKILMLSLALAWPTLALAQIARTRVAKLLRGYRDEPAADLDAISNRQAEALDKVAPATTTLSVAALGNDEWQALWMPPTPGRYRYTVTAWVDPFDSWRRELVRRVDPEDIRIAARVGALEIAAAALLLGAGLLGLATALSLAACASAPEAPAPVALGTGTAEGWTAGNLEYLRINGARLWVDLGFVSFQPGEIGKIALALFFAGYLVTARDSLSVVGKRMFGVTWPRIKDLGPIVVVWAVAMLVLKKWSRCSSHSCATYGCLWLNWPHCLRIATS